MPDGLPSPRSRRLAPLWVGALGAGLGLVLALVTVGLTRTSVDRATELTAAIAPPSANSTAVGEYDPPFWYQSRFELRQSFSGGAPDLEGLTTTLRDRLMAADWTLHDVDTAPGGTVIRARHDDLFAHVTAFGPPSTPSVRGVIYVWWQGGWPPWLLLTAGLFLGAGVAVGWLVVRRHVDRPRNSHFGSG